jgi:hypothetical protein
MSCRCVGPSFETKNCNGAFYLNKKIFVLKLNTQCKTFKYSHFHSNSYSIGCLCCKYLVNKNCINLNKRWVKKGVYAEISNKNIKYCIPALPKHVIFFGKNFQKNFYLSAYDRTRNVVFREKNNKKWVYRKIYSGKKKFSEIFLTLSRFYFQK